MITYASVLDGIFHPLLKEKGDRCFLTLEIRELGDEVLMTERLYYVILRHNVITPGFIFRKHSTVLFIDQVT